MADIPGFEERAGEGQTVSWRGGRYTKANLMEMEPVLLRSPAESQSPPSSDHPADQREGNECCNRSQG